MGFQQNISYKQVILTYRGALGTAKLLVLDTTLFRPTPWKSEVGFLILLSNCVAESMKWKSLPQIRWS